MNQESKYWYLSQFNLIKRLNRKDLIYLCDNSLMKNYNHDNVLVHQYDHQQYLYFLAMLFGVDLPLIYCLIFGALISPTDPITVIGILKEVGVKESIELKIEGESLFNDGMGVVVFTSLVLIASGETENIGEEIGHIFLVLSLHLISPDLKQFSLGLIIIFMALLARFISISLPFALLKSDGDRLKTSLVLTWGGLRGGISIALALSIPAETYGHTLLFLTFIVVIFSILVQGLSLGTLVKKLNLSAKDDL